LPQGFSSGGQILASLNDRLKVLVKLRQAIRSVKDRVADFRLQKRSSGANPSSIVRFSISIPAHLSGYVARETG
jgi:hypothetical protein